MPGSQATWRCTVCGYVHQGPKPPGVCPVCGASREAFERVGEPGELSLELDAPSNIVVIGAGIAGIAAVEAVRSATPSASVTLISQETELPYFRLNLTRYLAGEIARKDLPVHPESWYQTQQIQLRLGVEVAGLDLEGHAVQLRDGQRVPYQRLLLAAGAQPFVPPIPGANLKGVTTLRTLQDADYLLERVKAGARCVCIGGGILGLETAGALTRRGAEVAVLENHGWLLSRQLNERAGEILGDHVKRLGIHLRKKAVTREITGQGRVERVLLEDGSEIPADLVVVATGIQANVALARQAGLEVKKGVVVNDLLATSHPHVLAAGDVAEHRGVVYGLWTASQAQGQVAGQNLAGAVAVFGGLPRSNTLKVLGLELFSIGQIEPEGARFLVLDQEIEGRYFRLVFREGQLFGAILLGDLRPMAFVKKAVEGKRDCSGILRTSPTAQAVLDSLGTVEDTPTRLPSASPRPSGGANKETIRSSRNRITQAHRILGYVFLVIYLILLAQMVPRLWTYQIEFPARTVLHIGLGMTLGVILVLKILIVRFFRQLDQALVPALGTSLLVGSFVLLGISIPSVLKEALATQKLFAEENRERVWVLLAQMGLNEAECTRLSSGELLRAGQRVLRQECIECHDLRTVLARPRTPENWRQTVQRMAERTTFLNPLDEEEQLQVTAYLIALSPQLQRSTQQLREEKEARDQAKQAIQVASEKPVAPVAYDAAAAKRLFETKCSQCHKTDVVDESPPASEKAARKLVARMVEEGLKANEQEIALILQYLTKTYVKAAE